MSNCPRIAITSGEPAGIGPDLCIEIAQQNHSCELLVLADPTLLKQRALQLGINITIEVVHLDDAPIPSKSGIVRCLPIKLTTPVNTGELDKRNAHYVLSMLQTALDGCMSGQFDAMVTAPVNKGIINEANVDFTGHTEFLADGAGVDKVVMMLATSTLRVALATTHLPLKDVSDAITQQSLTDIITIINTSLKQQFGLSTPRIGVCGLNPHAGEDGYLGREELDVINPVIKHFQHQDFAISGSWPADTIFVDDNLAEFDVVLAMYHDQGLPVLKHQGFGQAVNVTLGLPFIRTSVDHGTALDLAGTGNAKSGSLEAAITMAMTMINSKSTL